VRTSRVRRFLECAAAIVALSASSLASGRATASSPCRPSNDRASVRADLDSANVVVQPAAARPANLAEFSIPDDPTRPRAFAVSAGTPPALWDAADAIVSISFQGKSGPELCNGIQVGPGEILTAAHCVQYAKRHVVHFGQLRLDARRAPGRRPNGIQCDAFDRQPVVGALGDFAILSINGQVPKPFDGMIAGVDDGTLLAQRLRANRSPGAMLSETRARMVQIINNDLTSRFHDMFRPGWRYLNSGDSCRIMGNPDDLARENLLCVFRFLSGTSYGLDHNCMGQQGSSGAALFDASEPVLIGLYTGMVGGKPDGMLTGAERYCAVSSRAIHDGLQKSRALARR
jgi:hypothetical protein